MKIRNLPESVQGIINMNKVRFDDKKIDIDTLFFSYVKGRTNIPKGLLVAVLVDGKLEVFASKNHKNDNFVKKEAFIVVLEKMLKGDNEIPQSFGKRIPFFLEKANRYFGIEEVVEEKTCCKNKPKTQRDILVFLNNECDEGINIPVIDGEIDSFVGITHIDNKPRTVYDYDKIINGLVNTFSITKEKAEDILKYSIDEYQKKPQSPVIIKQYK